jgi:hypothetical protein
LTLALQVLEINIFDYRRTGMSGVPSGVCMQGSQVNGELTLGWLFA